MASTCKVNYMKKELDEQLCRDFPLLYRDRTASPSDTSMCWGFPGDGWYQIIRRLSEKLEAAIVKLPKKEQSHYRASQVKEKYGVLRFYMAASNNEMDSWIQEAEEESERTCERCGAPGKLRGTHWLATLCDGCEK